MKKMTDIYEKALDILQKREHYWGVRCGDFDRAAAYSSAWWILYDAMNGNWEALEQFDTYETAEDEAPQDDWGYNEDMGFDPYMGCYTDDC